MTWRDLMERHALDGWAFRVLTRLAPTSPRPKAVVRASRLAPSARPRITVIIPCYNYARYLPAAVASALDQSSVDLEILIVDDKSTDSSREVAARIASEHGNVHLICNAENIGHVLSFNEGWKRASGDYIVKLDADDLLTPDSLSRAAALMEAYPTVGLVYGHPRHFETSVPPVGRIRDVRWVVWEGRDWLAERCRLGVSAITNPEMVLRASMLRELGPMNPAIPYAPDMEISLRLAGMGDIGWIGGADQAMHREHAGSMSATDGSGPLLDLGARAAAFDSAFAVIGRHSTDLAPLHEQANQALARDALRFASSVRDRGFDEGCWRPLVEFASEVAPTAVTQDGWKDDAAGSREGWAGPTRARIWRRAVRRLRHEFYLLRWTVRGV